MHLLAISGLHVGIFFMFLVRLANLLFVRRHHALLIAVAACAVYAMMTGLRPSVLRATCFISVFVVGELVGRPQRLFRVIAISVLLIVSVWPEHLFDRGAWLSFLSVLGLAWVEQRRAGREAGVLPDDSTTVAERIRDLTAAILQFLRY